MENNRSKYNNQLQINDLIDDAVENAIARRNQALNSEESLLVVSDEEAKTVVGGIVGDVSRTIIGFPPITLGLIAYPDETF